MWCPLNSPVGQAFGESSFTGGPEASPLNGEVHDRVNSQKPGRAIVFLPLADGCYLFAGFRRS